MQWSKSSSASVLVYYLTEQLILILQSNDYFDVYLDEACTSRREDVDRDTDVWRRDYGISLSGIHRAILGGQFGYIPLGREKSCKNTLS